MCGGGGKGETHAHTRWRCSLLLPGHTQALLLVALPRLPPTLCTFPPVPYALPPAPIILHPIPYALHSALLPAPYTLTPPPAPCPCHPVCCPSPLPPPLTPAPCPCHPGCPPQDRPRHHRPQGQGRQPGGPGDQGTGEVPAAHLHTGVCVCCMCEERGAASPYAVLPLLMLLITHHMPQDGH